MLSKLSEKMHAWFSTSLGRWIRDCVIVLLIFFGVSAWQTKDMLSVDGSVTAAPLKLEGLDGQIHEVFKDVKSDKPTLVYFFAPWCNICKMSINNLNALDTQKINIVRVALDYKSSADVIRFADKTRAEGPILLGNYELKHTFQIQGYPSYYLLDQDNKVVGRSMGYSTQWGVQLKSYLADKI